MDSMGWCGDIGSCRISSELVHNLKLKLAYEYARSWGNTIQKFENFSGAHVKKLIAKMLIISKLNHLSNQSLYTWIPKTCNFPF